MTARTIRVPDAVPRSPRAFVRWFVGVPVRRTTWANLAYLALAFPLGVAYFVVLVTGFVTGGALLIVLVGAPLLLAMVYAVRELSAFERWLADYLLTVDVPAAGDPTPDGVRENLKHAFTDLRTWTGVVYLFSKFAIGIGAFVVLTVVSAFTAAFLTVPLTYRNVRVGVRPPGGDVALEPSIFFELQTWQVGLTVPFRLTTWYVDSLPGALVVAGGGVLVGLVGLHLCNVLAWLLGWYTRLLLGGTDRSELRRRLDV